jgi:hypothetical protein
MSSDFIPRREADFAMWSSNLMNRLEQKLSQYGIPTNAFDNIKTLCQNFADAYELAENPVTRTSVAVASKNAAKTAFISALRQFLKGHVTYNEAVSDGDRRGMGLPIHDSSHTPVPAPSSYPDFTIDSSVIRCLAVHYHDHESGRRAKPAGVQGAIIRYGIMDAAPRSVEELPHQALDTRSPYAIQFDDRERGMRVYFCLAWQNNKGIQGPWSEIQNAIVP